MTFTDEDCLATAQWDLAETMQRRIDAAVNALARNDAPIGALP